jgi:proteasome lid subunit RPN8/RPN11
MDESKLVTAATFAFRHEAEIARALLESMGVGAMVQADDEGGLNPGFFEDYAVRVVVRDDDLAEANSLLQNDGHDMGPLSVGFHDEHLAAFRAHARFTLPDECCGLLAFDAPGHVRFVYCLSNVDRSPHRFTVDATEHFRAIQHAERNGWEIAGTFHSHPGGLAEPSYTDIGAAGDPSWIHVVIGGNGVGPEAVRAFVIAGGEAHELRVVSR